MTKNPDRFECEHQWETPDANGPHLCRKPPSHINDPTNDDHRCCCGANTWTTVTA